MKDKVSQGKKNRAAGARFERNVRRDLERKEWIVAKWMNNVTDGELHAARQAWNPFKKVLSIGTGFPDFIAFKTNYVLETCRDVIAVEAKINGILSKQEKEKCQWYLKNKIFYKILIAYQGIDEIKYKEVKQNE